MKIEHVAYQVANPVDVSAWYVRHLGLTVKRAQSVEPFGHFLADDGDSVMLEFYRFPAVPVPDYWQMDPTVVHIAFATADLSATRQRLIAAGATAVGEVSQNHLGDELAMLRDPWGLAIQLVKRQTRMIKS